MKNPVVIYLDDFNPIIARIFFLSALILMAINLKADPYYGVPDMPTYKWDCGEDTLDWCEGSDRLLYASYTHTAGYTYQWYRAEIGMIIPWVGCVQPENPPWEIVYGATSHSFSPPSSGKYRCMITNGGSADSTDHVFVYIHSNTLDILINTPIIQEACPGESVTLSVITRDDEVNCENRTKYMWYYMHSGGYWVNMGWEQSSTYNFTATTDGQQYRCRLAVACTTIYSNITTMDLPTPLEIITHPATPQTICENDNAIFAIQSSGGESPHSYQWQVSSDNSIFSDISNNQYYSNTNTSSLTVKSHADLNGKYYRCVVTDGCGSVTNSNSGRLFVDLDPRFTSNLIQGSIIRCEGDSISLTVTANGYTPITYSWYKDGNPYASGTTTDTVVINNLQTINAGNYQCFLSNNCASNVGSNITTVVIKNLPAISQNPIDVILCEGALPSVSFSAQATGSELVPTWEFKAPGGIWEMVSNGGKFSGADDLELTITAPDHSLDQYLFRCHVTGHCDPPVTTNPALLTVKTAPEIITHPLNDTACAGESMSFHVTATGYEPLYYKWKKGGKTITDWISFNTYIFDEVTMDDDTEPVICLVRNDCALITPVESDEAIIHVNPLPLVNLGEDFHLCPGEKTLLDPGTDYASYLWSTNAITKIIEVSEEGNYKLTVTDDNGCTNDDKVYVWLDPAIPAIDLGADMAYCIGEEISLDATDQYDSYEWSTDESSQAIDISETGTYSVHVSKNNSVCVESDTINIQVVEPFSDEEICLITVDMLTGKNIIVWEKTPDMNIVAYNIYRQTTTAGQYELLDTVLYDDLSIYKDNEADPEVRQWVYKITAIDTCNNESDIQVSPYHRPLFLEYNGTDDGVNLRWEPYVVEGTEMEFKTYEIYRGANSSALSYLDEISGDLNVYKDKDPNALKYKYYYRVAGVKEYPCYPSYGKKSDVEPYSHSMSNVEDNKVPTSEGISNIETAGSILIYPNPFSGLTTLRFTNTDHSQYRLFVRDLSGKVVRTISKITEDEIILERGNLAAGCYFLELTGKKIYRGIVIIE